MSKVETVRGKVKKVDLNGDTIIDFLLGFYPEELREDLRSDYTNDVRELMHDYRLNIDLTDRFIFVNDDLYEVLEKEDFDSCDIFEGTENNDGSISVLLQYYNGGCGFSEAVGYAINKMNK